MSQNSEEQPKTKASTTSICGAKTRNGSFCQNPPEEGRTRCWIHGGAKGSGAPIGNKNALKHGFYTAEAIAKRRAARRLDKESRELLNQLLAISG